jgi:hypothetical protein
MPKMLLRPPQPATKAEFFSPEAGLPERVEFVNGVIGPYSDAGKMTMLANWGADEIIRLTGPEIWRAALAAFGKPE